jgi:hypothetical protein
MSSIHRGYRLYLGHGQPNGGEQLFLPVVLVKDAGKAVPAGSLQR